MVRLIGGIYSDPNLHRSVLLQNHGKRKDYYQTKEIKQKIKDQEDKKWRNTNKTELKEYYLICFIYKTGRKEYYRECQMEFLVLEDAENLLGRDWLSKTGAVVNKGERKLMFPMNAVDVTAYSVEEDRLGNAEKNVDDEMEIMSTDEWGSHKLQIENMIPNDLEGNPRRNFLYCWKDTKMSLQ